jgi:hypothetical protein
MELNKKKKAIIAGVLGLCMVGLIIGVAAEDYSYTDPADDIICMTAAQWMEIAEGYDFDEAPSDFEVFLEYLDEAAEVGAISATPDCIDILTVVWSVGDPNTTLTITMEGNIHDCDYVQIMLLGNCSGEMLGFSYRYMTGEGEEIGYVDADGNFTESEGGVSGESVSWEFPTDDLTFTEDCSFFLIAFTLSGSFDDPESLLICFDYLGTGIYADRFNPGAGSYTGWDPITEFLDTVAEFIFWFMCGRLPYLTLMALLIIIAKLLMDRKNPYLHWTGFGLGVVELWSLFWYFLDINLLSPDPIFGISLMAIFDIITCICFILFIIVSYANTYNLLDDNEWLYYFGIALMLVQSLLFLLLPFFYYCAGQPTYSILALCIILVVCIILFIISEKHSKPRLK